MKSSTKGSQQCRMYSSYCTWPLCPVRCSSCDGATRSVHVMKKGSENCMHELGGYNLVLLAL